MNDSNKVMTALPLYLRRNKRTWLTVGGEVVDSSKASQPAPRTRVEWEATVVETTTNQAIEQYPRLTGNDVVRSDDGHSEQEIAQLYIEKCRFIDGVKPDIDLLKNNVNAGVWSISTEIKENRPI
jgi:hypothetical protein